MKLAFSKTSRRAGCLLWWLMTMAVPGASPEATQTVSLVAGWNAVWLEVEPTDDEGYQLPPEEVFDHPAIETIASPKPLFGTAEFFSDAPGSIATFNEEEWEVWNQDDVSDSGNLALIFGNRPYLIKVAANTTPFGVAVTGKARFFKPQWTPDRYNLVGFGLDGSRTFSAFFGPSGGRHPVDKIFRLQANGNWVPVAANDTMQSNQAYWVFSSGPSQYMGPVAVSFDHSVTGFLDFAGPLDVVKVGPNNPPLNLDLKELVFTNLGGGAAAPELDLLAVTPGLGSLSLIVVNPSTTERAFLRGNLVDSSPAPGAGALGKSFAGGETGILTLGAQRNWTNDPEMRTNLYRLRTGAGGASFYLPVAANLSNLAITSSQEPGVSGADMKGLWVGEVLVDSATSIVEDGAPVRPAKLPAPARLILHNDGSTVRLLSQVTQMETKTADAGVAPVPVLVLDPARIPFFQGIQQRRGKLVGLRIEAVTYDMPRKMDAISQASLLNDPAYPGLTAAGLSSFLVSRSTRPPSLKEVYHLSLNLAGTMGAGNAVSTIGGTLSLDPFHRSNPFRHPYHRDHPRGPAIVRELSIEFDAVQPAGERLRGAYTEVIKGLIKSDLTLSGRVELVRVSPVAKLDGVP
jgi:hypothetical protein